MAENKLVKKLAKVMDQVKYIQKKGLNKFNNYRYATESDVSEKVREVLAEQKVIMLPDVVEHSTREHTNRKGHTEYIATVKVKFTFVDGETGEQLSIHSIGEGQDSGDKAVYKAITGAQKYALMKAFMIPTGDDPEADTGVDERNTDKESGSVEQITQKQVGVLKAKVLELAKLRGIHSDDVYKTLKLNDVTKLSSKEADVIIGNLGKWITNAEQEAKQKQGA